MLARIVILPASTPRSELSLLCLVASLPPWLRRSAPPPCHPVVASRDHGRRRAASHRSTCRACFVSRPSGSPFATPQSPFSIWVTGSIMILAVFVRAVKRSTRGMCTGSLRKGSRPHGGVGPAKSSSISPTLPPVLLYERSAGMPLAADSTGAFPVGSLRRLPSMCPHRLPPSPCPLGTHARWWRSSAR